MYYISPERFTSEAELLQAEREKLYNAFKGDQRVEGFLQAVVDIQGVIDPLVVLPGFKGDAEVFRVNPLGFHLAQQLPADLGELLLAGVTVQQVDAGEPGKWLAAQRVR